MNFYHLNSINQKSKRTLLRIIFVLIIPISSFSQNDSEIVNEPRNKISLDVGCGYGITIGPPLGFYSNNEFLKLKFLPVISTTLLWSKRKKKVYREIGLGLFRFTGHTIEQSVPFICNSQTYEMKNTYLAEFNYYYFHYGIEHLFKNKNYSIIVFGNIGHSFESLFTKVINHDGLPCFESWKDYNSYYVQKSFLYELGTIFNYKVLSKENFKLLINVHSSFRFMLPKNNAFIGLGITFEYKHI